TDPGQQRSPGVGNHHVHQLHRPDDGRPGGHGDHRPSGAGHRAWGSGQQRCRRIPHGLRHLGGFFHRWRRQPGYRRVRRRRVGGGVFGRDASPGLDPGGQHVHRQVPGLFRDRHVSVATTCRPSPVRSVAMAWFSGATKMELQPESDAQPAIKPTQFIVHSIVAPWTARRTYEYWRDSTNLESHFGLGYDGDLAQYIGTETRADANASANRRADGTGAVSIETASNTQASDPWTDAQVEKLIAVGAWMHTHHGVPLRICRSHSDPGYGYHSL